MDLKDRPDIGWNALLGVAVAGILAAIWFGFVSPVKPTQASSLQLIENNQATVTKAAEKAHGETAQIQTQAWKEPIEGLGSSVLAYLTSLSDKHAVQLTGFRTDRSLEVANLTEAPYVLTVEGGFTDVLSFSHALEDPSSKLAVNMMQLSASDSAPGRVTATFGLLGFLFKEPK